MFTNLSNKLGPHPVTIVPSPSVVITGVTARFHRLGSAPRPSHAHRRPMEQLSGGQKATQPLAVPCSALALA